MLWRAKSGGLGLKTRLSDKLPRVELWWSLLVVNLTKFRVIELLLCSRLWGVILIVFIDMWRTILHMDKTILWLGPSTVKWRKGSEQQLCVYCSLFPIVDGCARLCHSYYSAFDGMMDRSLPWMVLMWPLLMNKKGSLGPEEKKLRVLIASSPWPLGWWQLDYATAFLLRHTTQKDSICQLLGQFCLLEWKQNALCSEITVNKVRGTFKLRCGYLG